MLLIVGTVDIIARLWSGDLTLCAAPCAGDPLDALAWPAWYVAANGLVLVTAALAYWLGGCVLGWWHAMRGDDATVASHGGTAWTFVIVLLVIPNVAGIVLLVADAVHADVAEARARSWLDVLTLASNIWVLVYYAARRRWDGRRERSF